MMSLHMKATMMKISDPIIFGHCVKVYFKVRASKHCNYLSILYRMTLSVLYITVPFRLGI